MSRIGKTLITIPSGVTITVSDGQITVKGPKGELLEQLVDGILVEQTKNEDGTSVLSVSIQKEELAAMWGTTRALINNMVAGVMDGWTKSLELNGVGFKMEVKGTTLKMRLGFSHEIEYMLPEGVTATIEKNVLTISGASRQQVGQVSAEIRAYKKPEPYKGKGFRYTDEVVRRKAGKAAKTE